MEQDYRQLQDDLSTLDETISDQQKLIEALFHRLTTLSGGAQSDGIH
jgi:hypothetical protein